VPDVRDALHESAPPLAESPAEDAVILKICNEVKTEGGNLFGLDNSLRKFRLAVRRPGRTESRQVRADRRRSGESPASRRRATERHSRNRE